MPDNKHLQTAVQVIAGLALNVYPAMFLAIYSRIAPIETQGFLALALAIGVFVAQLVNAFIVEGRLATPDADHDLSLPIWIVLLSLAAGGLLVIEPAVAPSWVLLMTSIGLMTGLLVGRSIGVVNGHWKREGFAAGVLVAAGVVALVLAQGHNPHCVRVLAVGAVLAVLTRYRYRKAAPFWGIPPDLRRAGWVTGETAVVGVIQPLITSVVLVTIGPLASVAFRVVSTVSGALEPILNYGRYRLLAHGHRGELVSFAGVFVVGAAAVLIGAFGGLGSLIFGPAWNAVGVAALLVACLWKGVMLLATVPFTALRKAGDTVKVFWVRCASTLVYLGISMSVLFVWKDTTAIFLAFVAAEIITALLFHFAAMRDVPEYAASFGHRRLRSRFKGVGG